MLQSGKRIEIQAHESEGQCVKILKKPEICDDLKTIEFEENFAGRPTPNLTPSRHIDKFINQKRDMQPEILHKIEQRPTYSLLIHPKYTPH